MAQTYVTDCFAAGNTGTTDLQNIENNFAALKSSFSGANAPSDLVAGMWWFDTTANILKLRNEANDAWQSVWDLANNKPIIANLANEITDTMVAAANKDGAANVACMRTLGITALTACAGNDARLAQGQFKIGVLSPARVMTAASGDVSYTGVGFQPNNIIFLQQSNSGSFTIGLDNGTNRYSIAMWGTSVPLYTHSSTQSLYMIAAAGAYQSGIVKTFDSDGFTITWTRTGSPSANDTYIYYMAFK